MDSPDGEDDRPKLVTGKSRRESGSHTSHTIVEVPTPHGEQSAPGRLKNEDDIPAKPSGGVYLRAKKYLRSRKRGFYKKLWLIVVLDIWISTSIYFGYNTNYVGEEKGVKHANVYLGCRDSYNDVIWMFDGDPEIIESTTYRCPATCLAQTSALVGKDISKLLDGGPLIYGNNEDGYSSDSWICSCAIHSGYSSNYVGGCFKISRPVTVTEISGKTLGGVMSLGKKYPGEESMTVFKFTGGIKSSKCVDYVIAATALNTAITSLVNVLSKNPMLSYMFSFASAFCNVVLYAGEHNVHWIVASSTRLITCLMYSYFVYSNFSRELFEKYVNSIICTIIYSCVLFVTLHFDTIFFKFKDVKLVDGNYDKATMSVWILMGLAGLIILVKELYYAYKNKKIASYILPYVAFIPVIFVFPGLFGLKFRIHHWLVGFVLLTALRSTDHFTVPVVGLGSGLFVEGIARWGLAPAIE